MRSMRLAVACGPRFPRTAARRFRSRSRRAARIRERLRAELGGKCTECGSAEDLHFDHIDPTTKSFSISARVRDTSIARLLEEVRKCQLLCSEHHKEKTRVEYRATRHKAPRLLLEAAEQRHARRHGVPA